MLVTIEEIRQLRDTLDVNRMEHEVLVTKARMLREHCEEIREICSQTSKEILGVIRSAQQSRQLASLSEGRTQPSASSEET
ncbi:hypothetical protein N9Y42_07500 [Mariniblastus sp.]|nr:hypothetical protein [Mariniblastus sp.]